MTVRSLTSEDYSHLRPLDGDPLTHDQKRRIKEYVESYLMSDIEERIPIGYHEQVVKKPICTNASNSHWALSKTYDSFRPEHLEIAKAKINAYHQSKGTGKTYEIFRRVIKDPKAAAGELGIDVRRDDQAFAAQKFMKVVIRNLHLYKSFEDLEGKYKNKMASVKRGGVAEAISQKNLLLMQNDPVQKIDPTKAATPLDIVLGNMFFQTPKSVQETITTGPDGVIRNVEREERGPTREQARQMIKNEISKLWQSPETRHVIQALATLITNEKGQIFFSPSSMSTGRLGMPYGATAGPMGVTAGFYVQGHHTLIMASLINPNVSLVMPENVGTFVHEALHFLFTKIVHNTGSPVPAGSAEERLLDEALHKDRELRKSINPSTLHFRLHATWNTLVRDLEQEPHYFYGGFNPLNPAHLQLMRVEAIVRVMEQVASGVPLAEIRKIAPNLCDFYYKYSKPMLERFAGIPPARRVEPSLPVRVDLGARVPLEPAVASAPEGIIARLCRGIAWIFSRAFLAWLFPRWIRVS